MSKYRKIDPKIWNDEHFRFLSKDGQFVFLFLLTHPHMTSLGAMRASEAGLCAELGWKPKAFGIAFRELFRKPLVKVDGKASFLWIPNFIKYNQPESPNVLKAWESSIDLIPECSLKCQLLQHVKDFAEGLPKAFMEALPKAFAKAMPYPEQEQEQEPKEHAQSDSKSESSEPPVLTLPLADKSEYPIYEKQITEYAELYPGIDCLKQLLKAKAWLIANPARRKTKRGIQRFIAGWLSRAQDTGKPLKALPLDVGGAAPDKELISQRERETAEMFDLEDIP